MKNVLIILLLVECGLSNEIYSQIKDSYKTDYILDDRITSIIKDFYKEKGYSKVISITFWIENYNSEKEFTDIPEVHFIIYPIKDLSSVLIWPPTFYTKMDSSIILINTGFDNYFSRNSSMMKNLIRTIAPFIKKDIEIISYSPFKTKRIEKSVQEIDDYPYGMEYIFKSENEFYYEKHETASSGLMNLKSLERMKMIIK
jgi:hypothetical protein